MLGDNEECEGKSLALAADRVNIDDVLGDKGGCGYRGSHFLWTS